MGRGSSNLLKFSIVNSTSVKLTVPESGHTSCNLYREVMLSIEIFINKNITSVSCGIDLLILPKRISFSLPIYNNCIKR